MNEEKKNIFESKLIFADIIYPIDFKKKLLELKDSFL